VTHEGTSEVKRARLNALMHEYELFRMQPNESISSMQKRFTHIINHLIALGKTFIDGEIINKVLRCLDRQWQPKVTAIMESKDLDEMGLATLFGKLQEHEMELGRLNMHEESDKRKKGISLKSTTTKMLKTIEELSQDENSDSDFDDETMGLLVKKFSKFLKRRNAFNRKDKNQNEGTYKGKTPKDKIKCHECGNTGHIKFQCAAYLKKKENEKKDNKGFKSKKAYVVWDLPEDPEEQNASTSDEEETINLCLMGKFDEEASTSRGSSDPKDSNVVTYSDSDSDSEFPAYNALYDAYVEMHKELQKLAKINIDRKRIILEHEAKILEMQKFIDELKLENETLDLIYSNASCDCEQKMKPSTKCESCKHFEKEVFDLKTKLASFTKGDMHLNKLLANQRGNTNKTGLGYQKLKNCKYRKLSIFSKFDYSKKPTCYNCRLFGHTTSSCNIKLKGVPNGSFVWIKKGINHYANHSGPKTIWVPKTCK